MERLLITGGCGFVGHRLAQQLTEAGQYQVSVADFVKPQEPLEKVKYHQVDLRNPADANSVFKNINVCVNLAALIGPVGYMDEKPATILNDNNLILANTFEAARENGLNLMMYSSSSMVYQQAKTWPHKEEDALEVPPSKNIYGFSKLLGEYYCLAYKKQYNLNYTIVRFFNIYGAGEQAHGTDPGFAHVIPDLAKRILSGQYPLEIIGTGKQTRCFMHVTDAVNALVALLATKDAKNTDYNIGTMDEVSMLELAQKIWQIAGRKEPFKVTHLPEFAHTTQRRVPDNHKLVAATDWEPQVSLDQGLKEIIEWLQSSRA